jgi:hypothetical protein
MRRRIVIVSDKMQRGYRYVLSAPAGRDFDPQFRPDLTPNVWSGRALQEVSSIRQITVLHQCIRPLIGACAPGHHGYQRACELISGQASTGPLGSPGFACAGKTDLPLSSHPLADLGGQTKLRHR